MNRGIRGEYIFPDDGDKKIFLEILSEKAKLLGVHLIGYCVMNNHYHVLLENSSGRMSTLLKVVNGSYGIYYRRKHGGKGYVFQNRFKSTLIQDDSYLRLAILYLLQNPVRAGLAANCVEYPWSSAGEYLGKARQPVTDVPFVQGLWGGKKFMIKEIMSVQPDKLPIKKSDFGDLLGEYEFLTKALERRDKRINEKSLERRRGDDNWFDPVEKVYWELEKENGIKFMKLDFGTLAGKQLRGELLVRLKELSGLTYREIAQLLEFRDIKL
ncbi:MAG: transposase, partial [Thermodesulfovibrionales bacterium]|nr:transposase [Thermodesulfovibrionales bacterium]